MKQKTQNNFSQCSKCGARILWVRMKSGKKMPVNPQFVNFVADGGKDRIVLANGEVTSGTITTDPGKASGFGYMSHLLPVNTLRDLGGKRSDLEVNNFIVGAGFSCKVYCENYSVTRR